MSIFNHYMNNHFGSCRLLVTGYDLCRNRDVKAYVIPGRADCIGLTDGTDAWIAPLTAGSSIFHGVDLRKLVGSLFAGENPAIMHAPRPKGARRAPIVLEPGETRVSQPANNEPSRRRHVRV